MDNDKKKEEPQSLEDMEREEAGAEEIDVVNVNDLPEGLLVEHEHHIVSPEPYQFDFEKIRLAPPDARWNIMMDMFEILNVTLWLPLDGKKQNELAERFKAKGMLKNVK